MKIYVVETLGAFCYQVGSSASKQVAEKKAKDCEKNSKRGQKYFVTEYTLGKDNWCEFE